MMNVMVYVVAVFMLYFAVALLRAATPKQGLKALFMVALGVWLMVLMLAAHTVAVIQFMLYGTGVVLTGLVMLLFMREDSSSQYENEVAEGSKQHKRPWLLPTVLSVVLFAVLLFFVAQTTGSYSANEMTPRIVAKTLWQNFTPILVLLLFSFVMGVMLSIQLLHGALMPSTVLIRDKKQQSQLQTEDDL